jgi:hypothetical protein
VGSEQWAGRAHTASQAVVTYWLEGASVNVAGGVGTILGGPVKRVGMHLGRPVKAELFSAHGLFMRQDGTSNAQP